MLPAFAISRVSARGRRAIAGVVCLLVGLPALFFVLRDVLPDGKPAKKVVHVELNITDAKTGMHVHRAFVRVYRKVNDRELPDMAPREIFDGFAMLKVRPETAKSSLAFLGIDASGYLPFNEPLVALIANGETRAGEHLIDVTLTPE